MVGILYRILKRTHPEEFRIGSMAARNAFYNMLTLDELLEQIGLTESLTFVEIDRRSSTEE